MPFLRLTRDRRGFENTFLLHADRPGDRPRLLYWYRTAPGIALGRAPLDEDAIRTIEENHPDIDFDWPAILALSEVMTPEEEETPAPRQPRQKKKRERDDSQGDREAQAPRHRPREERADDGALPPPMEPESEQELEQVVSPQTVHHVHGLLDELVGREIATRLRARYSEIMARIHEHPGDQYAREAWAKRAEPLNPDLWVTPEAVLAGVSSADQLFERLRSELARS